MYSFFIYNANRDRIGLLQNEESIQWLENYQSPGEVKIVARVTPENLTLLKISNRIYNTDSNTAAKISFTEIVENGSHDTIIVRANITSELLSYRVVMATENITNVEAGMYAIYQKNRRGLPTEISAPAGYSETLDTQITWNSVLDAEKTLAEASGLGFMVLFDPETGKETFKVYRGTDRSAQGNSVYIGYLGTDVDNISNVEIATDASEYSNVAVVAGEDSGENRAVRIVSTGTFTGEDRREAYKDRRDIQKVYQTAIDTGEVDSQGNPIFTYESHTYTDTEYNAMLDAAGREKLEEHLMSFSIVCDIEQNSLAFGTDYFLGDRMPVKLTSYGISASAIVASVNLIYESGDKRVSVSLTNFKLEET